MSFFSFGENFKETPENTFKIEFETDDISSFRKNINTIYHIGYINKYIRDTGSFIVIINSDQQNSTNAIFCISRSNKLNQGYVNKLIGSNQNNNEDNLEIDWNPGEYPRLVYNKCTKNVNRYDKSLNDKSNYKSKIIFYIKIIST